MVLISMSLKVLKTRKYLFNHLQVHIDLVVKDNDNCQRHDILDNAREQSIPDSVLGVKGIPIVPILGK